MKKDFQKPQPQRLFWFQLLGMLFKRCIIAKRTWGLLTVKVIIPLVLIVICYALLKNNEIDKLSYFPVTASELHSDNLFGFFETYPNLSREKLIIQNQFLTILEENYIAAYSHHNVTKLSSLYAYTHYPHYLTGFLVGGSFVESPVPEFVAWYNKRCIFGPSIAMNLMHTAILRYLSPNSTICITNSPLPYDYTLDKSTGEEDEQKVIILSIVPLITSFIGASFSVLPTHERATRTKLFQLMSGLSVSMYWLSSFIWDLFIYAIWVFSLALPTVFFYASNFYHTAFLGM